MYFLVFFICVTLEVFDAFRIHKSSKKQGNATKNTQWIRPVLIGIFINLVIFCTFLIIEKIDFNLFLVQYFLFPKSIGLERINDFNFTLNGSIFHFKFIYLGSVPLIYFTLYGIIKNKSFLRSEKFFNNIIILFFSFCLIFHQLITDISS